MSFAMRWIEAGESAVWLTGCQAGAQRAAPLQMMRQVMCAP
jgi:hypothetical protein